MVLSDPPPAIHSRISTFTLHFTGHYNIQDFFLFFASNVRFKINDFVSTVISLIR